MHFKIIMCNDDFEDALVCVIEMKCYAALTIWIDADSRPDPVGPCSW